ncbi:hypothetical protein EZS27_020603 [termite gut metagenome]|uniref:Uncharacterized protein n=1 Tax=termite gut metagenome TaxID=433724 RepID=A0A5J4RAD8_9ZZZZ
MHKGMKNLIDYFVNKNIEKYLDIYEAAFIFAVLLRESICLSSCERILADYKRRSMKE